MKRKYTCILASLLSADSLISSTVQDPSPREYFHLQWAGTFYIKWQLRHLQYMPTGQSILDNSSLKLSSQVILCWVKLTVKINKHKWYLHHWNKRKDTINKFRHFFFVSFHFRGNNWKLEKSSDLKSLIKVSLELQTSSFYTEGVLDLILTETARNSHSNSTHTLNIYHSCKALEFSDSAINLESMTNEFQESRRFYLMMYSG